MTGMATRAEQIAAHFVTRETAAVAVPYDTNGRQAAVDFLLQLPDGRFGALEVTLVTERESMAWQGMAAKEDWRWPSETSWEFRATGVSFNYKGTRRVVLRAVAICDEWSVDSPDDLPREVLEAEPEIAEFLARRTGNLRRTGLSAGIILYQSTRAEFIDSSPSDFSLVIERWHDEPHIDSHIAKAKKAPVSETHLFLVPLDDVLPARFFTDDFDPPERAPHGFEGIDVLWVWSNFWNRCLIFRDQKWRWVSS